MVSCNDPMGNHGLFIGVVTLDLVYLTAGIPENNQKIVAADSTVAAGGPATNAAVTFSYLGNQATLLGALGIHPIANLIRADLEEIETGSTGRLYRVAIADLAPDRVDPPPVSSIIVTQATGARAVVSINATKAQATRDRIPPNILQGVDVVLIDGHQMEVSCAIAQSAKLNNIPVVIDGGSWKPGFEQILPFVDYAICSANFYPPGCQSSEEVFSYLANIGIPHIAITRGEKPIQYLWQNQTGQVEIPKITAVDTLGAGDIFHGAFCHYLFQASFEDALKNAAQVAARACQFFGTRRWMKSDLSDIL